MMVQQKRFILMSNILWKIFIWFRGESEREFWNDIYNKEKNPLN